MTITAESASGKQPPAAKNVIPIMDSGILNVEPIADTIQKIKKEFTASHTMHMMNVRGYSFLDFLGLGIVHDKTKVIGHV